jgi:DNA-binding PadR family transcriptional regulator
MWLNHRRRWGGLRYIIIRALWESPKNGVEIMETTEKLSWGWWKPSPGSIYPLLNTLTEEKMIQKREDGRYELTDKGREEYNYVGYAPGHRAYTVESVLGEMDNFLSYLEDVQKSKLSPHAQKIEKIAERLKRLQESLPKE